jgi:serine/threonine protein kinase
MCTANTELSIFLAALELKTPAERAAYLKGACGSDAALLANVQELLAAHEKGDDFLDRPPPNATVDEQPVTEQPGSTIGPYKLMEQIGAGGMGLVFVAEQHQPVRRKVALKVIKPGMDTREVVARFEAERQALALMDHPNIARVLDAGATDSGRPYFVMELVRGVPITRFCDENRLTPRERLELFVAVCQAVQHAHQKGIIHRDLKPSNVLVTLHDGKAVPKVIDFGVAKAIGQQLTERTVYTRFLQMVGTPLYMSPEQAEMSGLDIDTRTDVYSLGVLLYELLTGSTPFDRKRLATAAFDEIRRIIREEDPPKPSTRLSQSGEALPALAAQRKTEPAKLSRLFRGELDWIVMKCLEKDRTRRYETANGLARDLQRYLADEPVEASPPSATYRLRKLVRRNKGPVLAVSLLLLALLGGIIGTTWGLIRAEKARQAEADRAEGERQAKDREAEQRRKADEQRQLAEERKHLAEANAQKAIAAEAAARREADKARAINQFLVEDLLTQAEPEHSAPADRVTLLEVLDRAADKVGDRFRDQPLLEASLRGTLGDVYHGLGDFAKAERHWSAALALRRHLLGTDNLETYRAMSKLGHVLMHLQKSEESAGLLRPAAAGLTRVLGAEHGDTLYANASLAYTYLSLRRLDEAIPLCEQTLEKQKAALGRDHLITRNWLMDCLALAYKDAGRLDKALPQAEQALEKTKTALGPDHPRTLMSMATLADVYLAAGQLGKAQPLAEEMLEKTRAKFGPDHASTLRALTRLASAYRAAGQLDKALPLFEQTLAKKKATLGPDHPDTLNAQFDLGVAYYTAGGLGRSIPLFEEILRVRCAKFGADHPGTIHTALNLAVNYRAAKRLDEAIALFDEWLPRSRQKLGSDHRHTHYGLSALATTYVQAKEFDRAVPVYRELLDCQSRKLPADHPDRANTLALLGKCLLDADKPADAEPVLRECLAIREKKLPDNWQRFNTQSLLGASLVSQKRYAEAEPLLLGGYEGLNQRQAKIPANSKDRLSEALERLGQLYDAWGKPEEAAKWRQELEARKEAAKEP